MENVDNEQLHMMTTCPSSHTNYLAFTLTERLASCDQLDGIVEKSGTSKLSH